MWDEWPLQTNTTGCIGGAVDTTASEWFAGYRPCCDTTQLLVLVLLSAGQEAHAGQQTKPLRVCTHRVGLPSPVKLAQLQCALQAALFTEFHDNPAAYRQALKHICRANVMSRYSASSLTRHQRPELLARADMAPMLPDKCPMSDFHKVEKGWCEVV